MKNQLTARIFSFFVIFSMLFSALGMANIVARAATTVTVESVSTPFKGNSSTSSPYTVSWSHTTGTGSNRLLLVGISYNANTNVSPVTAVSFTPSGGSEIPLSLAIGKKLSWLYRFAYIYYSPSEPPSGTTGTIKVTFAASVQSGVVAASANLAGVDTTTPIGPSNGFETVSAAPGVTVNGLVGDELVFDNLFMGGSSPAASVVGAGQTILTGWNTSQGNTFGGASTKDAGGSTSASMSWTPSGTPAGTFIWIHLAAAINPVCLGPRYTLTLGTDPNGTVTQSPAGVTYCAGRTITLTPAPVTTGYVFSGWGGANSADLSPAGGGAYTIVMNGDKSVTPIFALAQTAPCPNTANLNAVADTYISGGTGAALFNYGGATTLQEDRGTAATTRRYTLLKWDVSSIPANSIINSASVILNVTTASATGAFPMYDVTKPWVEGTQNGSADAAGASWTNYNTTGPFPWGTAGASQTGTASIDRDTVNLWSAASGSFTPVGSRAVNLTAGGLTVVRRWLAGGVNNGVIIQDTASAGSVPLAFTSREGATAPVLSVNYCLPAGGVTHDLTVAVDPPGAGTTTPSVGIHTYAENTIVPVTASAASGYIFDHWSGDCSGSTCSVTMGADMSVTANFVVAKNLTMAVATNRAGPGGTTSPSVGAHPYAINTTVDHITASTNTGYSFDHWSGACSGTDPTDGGCSVYMDDDKTVTANFTINTYALNLTFAGTGGGHVTSAPSGIDCTSDCSNSFDYNTPVVLTANPATGSHFDGWSGASCSGTGTCSVTMTAIRDVTATFSIIPTYDLTMAVDPVGGGTTDPAVGIHTYNDGTVVPIAATAASGYVFDHWTGAVVNANSASTTVTMDAIKTVTAHFTVAPFGYIGDAGPSAYADASGTSLVITVGSAGVAAGNTIMVGFASRGVSGYTTPTLADSKSNTYTSAVCSLAYSHGREYLFYAPVTTALVAGDTITLTSSPAVTNRVMVASVFSGLLTSGQLDQTKVSTDCSSTTAATASNDATSGATAATTQADELIIGLISAEDAGGTTPVDAGLGTWLNSFMAGATQKSQNTNSYRWRVSMGRYYASATGTFTAAQTYTNNPYWNAAVATFKAVPANHTVIFNSNGGTGTMSDQVASLPAALTLNTFSRLGYSFSGWNNQADGLGTSFADGATYPFSADATLYAQWTALPNHTVTFDNNGGSGAMSDQVANVPTALTLNTFTRAAYSFNGWNTQADGLGTNYADGATYPFSADATLYAQWTAFADYTVTFNSNGGTGTMSDQVANVPTALTLNTFTRVAYSFNGWNTQANGLGTSYANGATYPFSADATLYAQWTPICYALTLSHTGSGSDPVASLDHSTGCTAGKYISGEEIGLSGAVPGTGYQITGWTGTINNSSTAATNTVSMPASDHAAGVTYEDFTPPVLTITGATADGVDMSGSLSTGYILNTTNNVAVSDHLIQFKSTTSANEALKDTYFGLTLIGSTMSHDALKAYYAARGVPEPYLSYLIGAVDGINPFVYIKGNGTTAVSLVDAAKHDEGHLADVAMAVPDDFPRGTYTVQGQIQDLAGNPATVTLKLIVAGIRGAAVSNDYDGDGKTDPAKFVTGDGVVWWQKSTTGLWDGIWMGGDTFSYYGASDYDGDGKVDPAKFYPGTGVVWWVKSSTGLLSGQWLGPDTFTYISGSDFDGDGQSDPAKFYPGTGTVWWVKSTTGTLDGQWLGPDAFTYVSGSDFDGDGKTDPAKFYPETGVVWWVKSTTGTLDGMWLGSDTFTYVQASDFDGDGKTDPAKFYPDSGNLWWVKSTTGTLDGVWLGPGTFTYVAGSDFNGDGKTDPTKYDASTHTLSWLNLGTSSWTDIDMGTGTYELANGQ